jgi:hypothetical protein
MMISKTSLASLLLLTVQAAAAFTGAPFARPARAGWVRTQTSSARTPQRRALMVFGSSNGAHLDGRSEVLQTSSSFLYQKEQENIDSQEIPSFLRQSDFQGALAVLAAAHGPVDIQSIRGVQVKSVDLYSIQLTATTSCDGDSSQQCVNNVAVEISFPLVCSPKNFRKDVVENLAGLHAEAAKVVDRQLTVKGRLVAQRSQQQLFQTDHVSTPAWWVPAGELSVHADAIRNLVNEDRSDRHDDLRELVIRRQGDIVEHPDQLLSSVRHAAVVAIGKRGLVIRATDGRQRFVEVPVRFPVRAKNPQELQNAVLDTVQGGNRYHHNPVNQLFDDWKHSAVKEAMQSVEEEEETILAPYRVEDDDDAACLLEKDDQAIRAAYSGGDEDDPVILLEDDAAASVVAAADSSGDEDDPIIILENRDEEAVLEEGEGAILSACNRDEDDPVILLEDNHGGADVATGRSGDEDDPVILLEEKRSDNSEEEGDPIILIGGDDAVIDELATLDMLSSKFSRTMTQNGLRPSHKETIFW